MKIRTPVKSRRIPCKFQHHNDRRIYWNNLQSWLTQSVSAFQPDALLWSLQRKNKTMGLIKNIQKFRLDILHIQCWQYFRHLSNVYNYLTLSQTECYTGPIFTASSAVKYCATTILIYYLTDELVYFQFIQNLIINTSRSFCRMQILPVIIRV